MSDARPTLLVLAASLYQLEAIQTAKRLGYRVITVDNVPGNPGHALADRSYTVDTTDWEGVLDVARNEKVSGVLAACTDVAVPTAARVSEIIGLPGQPFNSAQILTSKVAFRQFLLENRFPVPQAHTVNSDFKPDEKSFLNGPWILKPDRSSGSKGIFVVRSVEELKSRLPETLSFSANRTGVLEKFVSGHQGTCEGILRNGRIAFSVLLDRQTAPVPYVTTVGHHLPTTLSTDACQQLSELIERVFNSLNIRNTVFDCDFVVADGKVFLIEISPRVGGNSIAGLLRRATGFDIMEYAVRHAVGDVATPRYPERIRPAAVLLLGVWEQGLLRYNEAEAEMLRREEWVDSLEIDLPLGATVYPFINGRFRIGEAFIFGNDRSDVDAKARSVRQRLNLRSN